MALRSQILVRFAIFSSPSPTFSSTTPWVKQAILEWCWAACIEMVSRLVPAPDVGQCEAAALFLGEQATTCCQNPDACAAGCPVNAVEVAYQKSGMSASYLQQPPSFEELKSILKATLKPVQVGWDLGSSTGHALLVVDAFEDEQGREVVEVRDPRIGSGLLTFQELMTANGTGTWRWTWTNLG